MQEEKYQFKQQNHASRLATSAIQKDHKRGERLLMVKFSRKWCQLAMAVSLRAAWACFVLSSAGGEEKQVGDFRNLLPPWCMSA
jgi:hypothetical protein